MDKAEKIMIFVSFLLVVGSEAANLLTPLIVANAYDVLVDPTITDEEERMSQINYYMIIAIVVTVAGIIAGFLRVTVQVCIIQLVVNISIQSSFHYVSQFNSPIHRVLLVNVLSLG